MADYWKSQGRKFCDFCECWIADNKPSIEFHDNGKKHKNNVSRRLKEIHKNSSKQMKETKKIEIDLRKMENAAMAAYLKDLEEYQVDLTAQDIMNDKKRRKDQISRIDINPNRMPAASLETNPRHKSSKNLPSNIDFCDPMSLQRVWDGKATHAFPCDNRNEDKTQNKSRVRGEKRKWKGNTEDERPKHLQKLWYESHTSEGWTYYWHVETKETSWEPPAEGFMTTTEQQEELKEQQLQAKLLEQLEREELKEQPNVHMERRAHVEREGLKNFKRRVSTTGVSEDQTGIPVDQVNSQMGEKGIKIPYWRDYSVSDITDPYGPWQIIKIDDKKKKVNLQLPGKKEDFQDFGKRMRAGSVIPLRTFAEKTVSQIDDSEDEGSLATFKKRKLRNKNMRKRYDDNQITFE